MTNSTETNPILTPELLQSLLTKAKNAAHDGRLDEADELADDFICKFGDHYSEEIIQISETQWRESLVFYLSSRGERFENKKMYSEALSNYERIIEIASDNEGLPLTDFVHYPYAKIEAMWRCALMLDRLKRGDEAYYILSRIQRDLKAKYQYNSDVSIAVYYSKSMLKQAAILEKTGQTKKALRTLDRIIDFYSDIKNAQVQDTVAESMVRKAGLLAKEEKTESALSIYNEVITIFGDTTNPRTTIWVWKSLNKSAGLLDESNHKEEAQRLYGELLRRTANIPDWISQMYAAWALLMLSQIFKQKGDLKNQLRTKARAKKHQCERDRKRASKSIKKPIGPYDALFPEIEGVGR